MSEGGTTVGSIVGDLRLDISDWVRKVDQAKAKARELDGSSPDVTVRAEVGDAIVKLDAAAAATARLAAAEDRLRGVEERSAKAQESANAARARQVRVMESGTATLKQKTAAEEAASRGSAYAAAAAGRLQAAEQEVAAARVRVAEAAALEGEATERQAAATVRAADVQTAAAARVGRAQAAGERQAIDWRTSMISGLVAVSAAAPPVAAGAVAITGGFGAMGVAGVLALTGIVRGLKDGTTTGRAYAGIVADLVADVHRLQDTAAAGLLPGAEKSVSALAGEMPALTAMTGKYAALLGDLAPTGLDATVTLLGRADPLFQTGATYLAHLAGSLDGWAHSNGYQDFLDYTVRNGPEVEKFLGDAGHLAVDFLTAWGQVGETTLPILDRILARTDDLVKGTGPLVPAAIAVFGAYKMLAPVGGVLKGLVDWTRTLGTESVITAGKIGTIAAAEKAAGRGAAGKAAAGGAAARGTIGGALGNAADGSLGLAGIAGVAGVAVGGAYLLGDAEHEVAHGLGVEKDSGQYAGMSVAQNKAEFLANSLTASGGLKGLLGQSDLQRTVQNSPLGNFMMMQGGQTALDTMASRNLDQRDQALAGMVQSGDGKQAKAIFQGYAEAADMQGVSVAKLKQRFPEYIAALAAAEKQQPALTAATRGTTAAILDASAATERDSATADQVTSNYHAWKTAIDQARAAHDRNATAIRGDSDAAIANRTAIRGQLDIMRTHVGEMQKASKSTLDISNYTAAFTTRLVTQAAKLGLNRDQVVAFVSQMTGIPRSKVTQFLVPGLTAAQSQLRNLLGILGAIPSTKSVTITTDHVSTYSDARDAARGGAATGGTITTAGLRVTGLAAGGTGGFTVHGPGHASSDAAGIFRLANREEVVSNLTGQADRFRPVLKAINAGKVRTPADLGDALGGRPVTHVERHQTIQVNMVNPVAQDPVQAAEDAAQMIAAHASMLS